MKAKGLNFRFGKSSGTQVFTSEDLVIVYPKSYRRKKVWFTCNVIYEFFFSSVLMDDDDVCGFGCAVKVLSVKINHPALNGLQRIRPEVLVLWENDELLKSVKERHCAFLVEVVFPGFWVRRSKSFDDVPKSLENLLEIE